MYRGGGQVQRGWTGAERGRQVWRGADRHRGVQTDTEELDRHRELQMSITARPCLPLVVPSNNILSG